ncbi:phosphatidylserine decarboxylase [bacterium]|nr:phosphatidylserine decarboxylase [bacterium]
MSTNFDLFKRGPLHPIVKELKVLFENDKVLKAYNEAIKNVKDFPEDPPLEATVNIWRSRSSDDFYYYFNNWYDFLATPTEAGLGFIEPFTQLYYKNDKAFDFLNTFEIDGEKVIFDWTVKFIVARGKFMDTPGPVVSKAIEEWVKDPATHIKDYIMPPEGYQTFNEFFTRQLRPGARPVADVADDAIVVASADSELNMIDSALVEDSKIKTKGHQKLGVKELLNEHPSWKRFLGGTAISCVLLPSDYHNYHAPVTGKLIHHEIVPGIYNGVKDAPEWFHNGNVGSSDGDFSIFEQFHRGFFIFETKNFGHVAMVVVGLNTISKIGFEMNSVNTLKYFMNVSPEKPEWVYKGKRLGYFKYGGSLNILLFEQGAFQGIKVLQGQRIGKLAEPNRG